MALRMGRFPDLIPRPGHQGALLLRLAILTGVLCGTANAQDIPTPEATPSSPALSSFPPEVDMLQGGATQGISIAVPPGRRGMTPDLALVYQSGAGPSLYGLGWDLPVGRIQRRLKMGQLTCATEAEKTEFVLLLPGSAVEFFLDEDDPNLPGYAHVEESFFRIRNYNGASSGNYWEVWDTSGRKYVFGRYARWTETAADRPRTGNNTVNRYLSSSCSSDQLAAAMGYTFTWELTRTVDPNGNWIDIKYLNESGVARPDFVEYGGNDPLSATPLFKVEFVWADRAADDRPATAKGGFTATITKRLSRLEVLKCSDATCALGAGGSRVRAYDLTYDDARMARKSALVKVLLSDSANVPLKRHDNTEGAKRFSYHGGTGGTLGLPNVGRRLSPSPLTYHSDSLRLLSAGAEAHLLRDLIDINGDGFPDLVDTASLNNGNLNNCANAPGAWNVYLGSPGGFATPAMQWALPNARTMCALEENDVSGSRRRTVRAAVDITGDGVIDYVDATTDTWKVYRGWRSPELLVGGFVAGVENWPGPSRWLRQSESGATKFGYPLVDPNHVYEYQDVVVGTRDLVDINGDGLLDVVQTPYTSGNPEIAAPWQVWVNRGKGHVSSDPNKFAPVKTFDGALNVLTMEWRRRGSGLPNTGLSTFLQTRDFDGDGLPDQILTTNGRWQMYRNDGQGILTSAPEDWGTQGDIRYLEQIGSDTKVWKDTVDANGDGLPDLCTGSDHWWVALNRGKGFATAQNFANLADLSVIRRHGDGTIGTLGEPRDVDGDGLLDAIYYAGGIAWHNVAGAWCPTNDGVTCTPSGNTLGRNPFSAPPDLLFYTENESGGLTVLGYRPSAEWDDAADSPLNPRLPTSIWTLARVVRSDGMCNIFGSCVSDGSHSTGHALTYEGAYFNPITRVFFGFAKIEMDQLTSGPSARTKTEFRQDAEALRGKISKSETYGVTGGTPTLQARVTNTWHCGDPAGSTQATGAACDFSATTKRIWVHLGRTTRTEFDNTGAEPAGGATTEAVNDAWDTCGGRFTGQVMHRHTGKPSGTPHVQVSTEHACLNALNGGYIVDRPKRIEVREGATAGTGARLQEQWLFYDGQDHGTLTKGDHTRIEAWLDTWAIAPQACAQDNARKCVKTELAYDSSGWGNLVEIVDPNNTVFPPGDSQRKTTTISYSAKNLYPTVVTNPLGHKRSLSYDLGCGALTSATILYTGGVPSEKETRDYDSFCRLTAIHMPNESAAYRLFEYALGGPMVPTAVRTLARETQTASFPYSQTRTAIFTDALGRTMQRRRWDTVGGLQVTVTSDHTEYDDRGNVSAVYAPFSTSGYATSIPYQPLPGGTPSTTYVYDALGRLTKATDPFGAFREVDHSIPWENAVEDENWNEGWASGAKIVTKRDALGRIVDELVYGFSPSALRSRTAYTYDGLGRLLTVTQGDSVSTLDPSTRITVGYDSLGRRTSVTDPDTGLQAVGCQGATPGTWRYRYDHGGNLIFQDDPKLNQTIYLCHDAGMRLRRRCSISSDGFSTALYPAAVCGSVECNGDQSDFFYDEAGSYTVGRLTRVQDGPANDPVVVTLIPNYNVRGQPLGITRRIHLHGIDPHVGGNPTYSEAVLGFRWDEADRIDRITYPRGENVFYKFDPPGHVREVSGGNAYLSGAEYDLFGRPTEIRHGNGVNEFYGYEGTGAKLRLKTLRVTTRAEDDDAQNGVDHLQLSYTEPGGALAYSPRGAMMRIRDLEYPSWDNRFDGAVYAYDALDRLTSVTGAFSSANETFGYDVWGNMTGKGPATFAYGKPHQMAGVTGALGNPTVAHDDNGNRTAKLGVGVSVNRQTYTYDAYDQLMRVQVGDPVTYTIEYRYDYAGRRVAKIVNGSVEARYYGPWAEKAGSTEISHYLVGDRRLATGRYDGAGSVVDHVHANHLGSSEVLTDESGGPLQHIRYKAFGFVRGRYPGATGQPVEAYPYEFTGYETELHSDLEYAGARFYDPTLASFLTHDPAREFASPYSYVGWNPINATDPSGAASVIFEDHWTSGGSGWDFGGNFDFGGGGRHDFDPGNYSHQDFGGRDTDRIFVRLPDGSEKVMTQAQFAKYQAAQLKALNAPTPATTRPAPRGLEPPPPRWVFDRRFVPTPMPVSYPLAFFEIQVGVGWSVEVGNGEVVDMALNQFAGVVHRYTQATGFSSFLKVEHRTGLRVAGREIGIGLRVKQGYDPKTLSLLGDPTAAWYLGVGGGRLSSNEAKIGFHALLVGIAVGVIDGPTVNVCPADVCRTP